MASGKLHPLQGLTLALLLCVVPIQAQSGDGGSAEGFSNSNLGGGNGADGSSNSSANLSKGAIIAIAVVVALVVFGGSKHELEPILPLISLTNAQSH